LRNFSPGDCARGGRAAPQHALSERTIPESKSNDSNILSSGFAGLDDRSVDAAAPERKTAMSSALIGRSKKLNHRI
jgi:hypothetical protein